MKTRLGGFTLMECLVALLVIAGSLSLYQGLSQVLAAHTQELANNHREDFILFAQQFRSELAGSQLDRLEQNRLYVTKKGQALSFGKFRGEDFRKANASGLGYQPMLFEVAGADFSQEGELVTLRVTFTSGLERTFIYAFPSTD